MSELLGESRFWRPLWRHYAKAPSIALCRVPELEYASHLGVDGRVLDHCCGDGQFAALAWPGKVITAGCDINPASVARAQARRSYGRCDVCDAARLPYDAGTFDLVFDNSALEHIADLDAALAEVARVLVPGGVFAFNVLNYRYFEWWPLDEEAKTGYRRWQPFFHALRIEDWRSLLERVGLRVEAVEGYFDQAAARELALLDCEFSGAYNAGRSSRLVRWYRLALPITRRYWQRRLSTLTWKTDADAGAGYFIKAVRLRG